MNQVDIINFYFSYYIIYLLEDYDRHRIIIFGREFVKEAIILCIT
jgi:hypothetical protein